MISTKGRYALRIMTELAENSGGNYMPLKDLAESQKISKKYLELIVRDLVSGGLLEGISGKGGGYRLVKDPSECTLGEILELTEGTLAPVACLKRGSSECPNISFCRTIPMWKEYDEMIRGFFFSRTLKDLMKKEN